MKSTRTEKHITTSETAQMLGISVSSVKNWVRHGFIESVDGKTDLIFLEDDVLSLRSRILSGDLKRLNSRANKSNSLRTFLPDELFKSSEEKRAVSEISSFVMRHNIPSSTALFFLSLNLLKKRGMLGGKNPEEMLHSADIAIRKRKHLGNILTQWRDSLSGDIKPEYLEILKVDLPDHDNVAGIIYQSTLAEGDKSRHGSYYTPDDAVSEITGRIAGRNGLFLDPCCGTGQFLIAFAGRTENPENIYGIDIDPVAVNVAKINLIMKFPDMDFNPKIFCADTLLDYNESIIFDKTDSFVEFDCIATNPPWGSHFSKKELSALENFYPEIVSGESFSFFLVKSLRMLKDGGTLSFILPESMLNVKMHGDIRKYIVSNHRIARIERKKKIFKNVFSAATVIDIVNRKSSGAIEIVNEGETFSIRHDRFGANKNFGFDICIDPRDEKILSKIYSRGHVTLKDNASWALGIVTGNNPEYLRHKKDRWSEPVIKGKDIHPFKINEPDTFIKFEPEKFQQTADVNFYRSSEKLVYRYISKRLIFAIDRERRVTLNSSNILIPLIDGVDMEIIMALFNSELYQYIFQKKFSSVKVLRSHLEELPVPILTGEESKEIVKLVEDIESGKSVNDLNGYIYRIFGLSKSEIDHIKSRIK